MALSIKNEDCKNKRTQIYKSNEHMAPVNATIKSQTKSIQKKYLNENKWKNKVLTNQPKEQRF